MSNPLSTIEKNARHEFEAIDTLDALEAWHKKYLGKNGELTLMLKQLGGLSVEEKKTLGKATNELKTQLEGQFTMKKNELESKGIERALKGEWIDLTAPGTEYPTGHVHPIAQTQEAVENIFLQMGFTVVDGPEIESEFYNFEGLNVPAHHPARDMQDTFFLDKKPHPEEGHLVLRTHTSPAGQVRALLKHGAPLRVIAPGRCFRNEATDASHEHTFDQVEGMLIDKNISIADLKGIMLEFLSQLFKKSMKVRFRPGYFPFVEPGLELEMSCVFCDGNGCRVCKKSGWIEFMGCGMTHPHVLKTGGVNPDEYQGWAFGFGLTRLVMMRYGINDIRYLTGGDIRFLEQF